jgi:hypothetical protein
MSSYSGIKLELLKICPPGDLSPKHYMSMVQGLFNWVMDDQAGSEPEKAVDSKVNDLSGITTRPTSTGNWYVIDLEYRLDAYSLDLVVLATGSNENGSKAQYTRLSDIADRNGVVNGGGVVGETYTFNILREINTPNECKVLANDEVGTVLRFGIRYPTPAEIAGVLRNR